MPPKTRPTQIPERTPPVGLRSQRTTSSESAALRRKHSTDRSPNLMIRGSQSDPLGQKKLGTRVSSLETQLIQAQQELKNLKQQLSSAETTKKERTKKNLTTKDKIDHQGKCADKEMDVFEVPMRDSIESKPEESLKLSFPDEIEQLKAELDVKENELESALKEKEILKNQLNEVNAERLTARVKEEEMVMKCSQLEKDLEESKFASFELKEKMKDMEEGKEELEVEMKKLRIQTEQWRKAADAAASVLARGVDVVDGVRVSGKRGSVDKHFNGVFDDDLDDGKIKGSVGIRMFGDLWKKK